MCHFCALNPDSAYKWNQPLFLLPVYIFPIFSSGNLTHRDWNANDLCSESGSIICMQLNDSHNAVLLAKHPLKNIFIIFSSTHKITGLSIQVDSVLLKYFLSQLLSSFGIHVLIFLKLDHIFMPLRYPECRRIHSVYLERSRIIGLADGRIVYTSGYDDFLVIAEVTLDLLTLQLQTILHKRLFQHRCS